jgi:uncharacterized phage protein (TIGR02218 family)
LRSGLHPKPRALHSRAAGGDDRLRCQFGIVCGGPGAEQCRDGSLCWLDGPQAGQPNSIIDINGTMLVLEHELDPTLGPGTLARVREGCDHTIATCAARFGNSINFQGEPFLPGNDLLTRYPQGSS